MTGPRRAAAVDVGSTSVHLLVADLADDGLTAVLDLSELLGLGETVERTKTLGAAGRESLVSTLGTYAAEARRLEAATIAFVGTDPLRHAADAARACVEVERATGVPIHVLDQDEEGSLTLLGATHGRVHGDVAVIDIGGGSTEIVVARADGSRRIVGLPIGASRLSTAVGVDDPPTPDQVAALHAEARRVVATAPALVLGEVIAVGGTTYGVARVATGPGFGERQLDPEGIVLAVSLTSRERSAHVAELFGLNPRRAKILPAGAAIFAAIVERYRIDRVTASEQGIREGLVRVIVDDPIGWRDRLGRPVT